MTLFAETPNGSVAQTNRFHRLVLSDNNARPLIMLRTLRPREMRKLLIVWSGLSESNRHLNLGKSAGSGVSTTYEALSGALSST